jgi:hypothetical protein
MRHMTCVTFPNHFSTRLILLVEQPGFEVGEIGMPPSLLEGDLRCVGIFGDLGRES